MLYFLPNTHIGSLVTAANEKNSSDVTDIVSQLFLLFNHYVLLNYVKINKIGAVTLASGFLWFDVILIKCWKNVKLNRH